MIWPSHHVWSTETTDVFCLVGFLFVFLFRFVLDRGASALVSYLSICAEMVGNRQWLPCAFYHKWTLCWSQLPLLSAPPPYTGLEVYSPSLSRTSECGRDADLHHVCSVSSKLLFFPILTAGSSPASSRNQSNPVLLSRHKGFYFSEQLHSFYNPPRS